MPTNARSRVQHTKAWLAAAPRSRLLKSQSTNTQLTCKKSSDIQLIRRAVPISFQETAALSQQGLLYKLRTAPLNVDLAMMLSAYGIYELQNISKVCRLLCARRGLSSATTATDQMSKPLLRRRRKCRGDSHFNSIFRFTFHITFLEP